MSSKKRGNKSGGGKAVMRKIFAKEVAEALQDGGMSTHSVYSMSKELRGVR